MALTDSLISYWKLDEASGDALDAHGSNTLTDNNTVMTAAGKINTARDFEHDNTEYFSKADNADLSTGNIDFTFNLWFSAESDPGFPMLLSKDDVGSEREYGLYLDSGTLHWYTSSNGTSTTEVTVSGVSTATWYMVTAWHDSVADVIGIALNAGTPVTTSEGAGVRDGAAAFNLGARNGSLTWDGLIDEVGFWKRVLTSGERTQLYNSGAGLAYPFTVAYDAGGAMGGSFPIRRTTRPRPFAPGLAR